MAPRPKKNNLASSVHKILRHVSLNQSMCSLANCNLFIFSTNLDDVSYDRLIWKRCNVVLEGSGPGDKLFNVIVYFMTVKKSRMSETLPACSAVIRFLSSVDPLM